jgi:hypothetical protein
MVISALGGSVPVQCKMVVKPTVSIRLALAIVTACTLAEQVVITRLFSAAVAYHFGFLAISIGLLGTGSAALLLYVRSAWFRVEPVERLLALGCVAFALSLVLVPIFLVRLDFTGIQTLSPGFVLNLTAACVLASLPPLASGFVVAVAIARFPHAIGTVYAYDLVGAGLGSVLVVPLLNLGPAPTLLVVLGIGVALAAMLVAPRGSRESRASTWAAALGLLVFGLSIGTKLLYLAPRYGLPPGTVKVGEHWTALTRAIGYEQPHPEAPGLLFYDRVYAPVMRNPVGFKELGTGPQSIGFAIAGPGPALIIGGGGGRDIYNALTSGRERVDVIELMDANRRVVDEDLAHISGSPYSRPGVHTVIGDGRSVLAARDTKYAQIHIGFTDTLSANAAQGFALTENNLYTLEAFDAYFDHLLPDGVLNVSRLLKLVGDEALRATVLTLAALERRGVADPFQHVVVVLGTDILGPPTGTVLARLTPFTEAEIATIRELASERANGLLLVPGGPNRDAWKALADAPSITSFCQAYPLDVCPPNDDRPFFFNMTRLGDLGRMGSDGYHYTASPTAILLVTLAILAVFSAFGFLLPLRLVEAGARAPLSALSYFSAIGLGFLLAEIVLIQRFVLFLGFPTYALSIVLFALLIFSGIGALFSSRWMGNRTALLLNLSLAASMIGLSSIALEPLLRQLIHLPFFARTAVSVALLGPLGFCLGVALPLGLQRFTRMYPRSVAHAWGINGVTSVLASVLGTVIAIHFGFKAASLAAAACYLFALAHAAFGRWPETSVARETWTSGGEQRE